jgi:two-component system cell cycle response regulator
LGSRNGTRINGVGITDAPHRLERGDIIELGLQTVLRVSFADEAETRYARQMYDAVLRDGLTGVYNRRYFESRLRTEIAFARRHETNLALVMIDIDHFKLINDTHGHPVGDAVLCWLVDLVELGIRTEDVFARYGGEEFAILCRETGEEQAAIVAERVRGKVAERPFQTGESRQPNEDENTASVSVKFNAADETYMVAE